MLCIGGRCMYINYFLSSELFLEDTLEDANILMRNFAMLKVFFNSEECPARIF
jgi:hypothetical protein